MKELLTLLFVTSSGDIGTFISILFIVCTVGLSIILQILDYFQVISLM